MELFGNIQINDAAHSIILMELSECSDNFVLYSILNEDECKIFMLIQNAARTAGLQPISVTIDFKIEMST